MCLLPMTLRNLKRCGFRSVLCILICTFATMLLHFYLGNIADLGRTLEKLPEAIEVSAKICNLDGSMDQGLKIDSCWRASASFPRRNGRPV